ncbi:MAG: hypothetical protein RLZZ398_1500 [Verrucomicrobiota bacterium]|jgi:hypothetical protein
MAEPKKSKSGGGCLSKLLFLILLVPCIGLGAAVFYAVQPQDLTDLGGYGPAVAKPEGQREMKAVLKNAINRSYPLTLSETEINQWLARTLVAEQGGFLKGKITLKRVWVRLEDGRAEVVMERDFLGKPFTVSMYLQVARMESPKGTITEIERHGGPYHKDFPNPPQGGRFGKLVVPQGFLLLIMPAYEKLAAAFPEEIELAFREMARITIENDRLVLDPRQPMGQRGMPKIF